MTELKIKKLRDGVVIPHYATAGAAGLDLQAVAIHTDGEQVIYYTGLGVEIPEGHVGLLTPRSSIYKTTLTLVNGVGVIDSDYRGELILRFWSLDAERPNHYVVGDRIGQLVIVPLPRFEIVETDNLSDTARGHGGFGSTGR
jgi:dUTP pyrophosphatase